jgi:glycosyltransferase involved in cell wall biosynthesis
MTMKLSILIPAYNEEKTIHLILNKVLAVDLDGGFLKEIIIVDDCSTDKTIETANNYINLHKDVDMSLYQLEKNQGKGAALHRGIDEAKGDYIVIQDADLEYDPKDYNLLLKPVIDGHADVVYGSRFLGRTPHRALFYWHSTGNKILTSISNIFSSLKLSDMETCYKLFKADYLKQLYLREKRFGFEPEVTAKISRIPGIRIYEVGISYYGRTYKDGKKIGAKDGFWAIWCILKYNIWSRKSKNPNG